MRFYSTTKLVRIGFTVVWCGIAVFYLFLVVHAHRRFGLTAVLALAPSIQTATLWCTYWEVIPDALVQHGILYRREIPAANVTYAGPVRSRRLRWWASKSIQLDARQLPSSLYIGLAERTAFLEAVRLLAPEAEIVMPGTASIRKSAT